MSGEEDPIEALSHLGERMGMRYYDRQGQPITMRQWVESFEDFESKRVALTFVGDVRISTVWLGLDHNFANAYGPVVSPPLIFETMVFGGPMDQEPYRWATEQEAIEGHEIAVAAAKLSNPTQKEDA